MIFLREIKEKVIAFKPKIKATNFKPKTSGDFMKIKVMKSMTKAVRGKPDEQIQSQKVDTQAVNDLQARASHMGVQAKNEIKNMVKKSSRKRGDFSRIKQGKSSPAKLKQDFQRSRIQQNISTQKGYVQKEVVNNAQNRVEVVKKTTKKVQDKIQDKMKNMAQKRAMKKAQQQAAETAKETAVQAAKWSYEAAKMVAKKIAVAMVRLARIGIAALGGGGFIVAFIAIFAIIAAVVASPFGIFYSGEDKNNPDTVPISAVVGQLNADFGLKLEEIQDSVAHDSVTIDGSMADWCEVLAVFAVKANEDNDVVTIDQARVEQIKAVFWDMNSLTYDVEVVESTDDEGNSTTETILHIHINHKTADDMRTIYAFTDQENEALDGILEYRSVLLSLMGNLNEIQGDAQQWIDNLDPATSDEQRKIVEAACSLVGKVNYFWGGKFPQIGWNPEWGSLKQVTADGSPTTGTMRVYGLDCSGFVTWVFINASGNTGAYSIIGDGTKAQWANCTQISSEQAQIGDLAFYGDLSHVGIVIGKDADGNLAICNCASGANNVVITGTGSGFTLFGRPSFSMFE